MPPGITITERFDILKNLFWAVDNEIRVAKGLNYYCISGEFNQGGMSDMDDFAAKRKLTRLNIKTRLDKELDAIFVSEGVEILSTIASRVPELSDHSYIISKLRFKTSAPFTKYLIDEPIPQSVIRQRLVNNNNAEKQATYNLRDGPFS